MYMHYAICAIIKAANTGPTISTDTDTQLSYLSKELHALVGLRLRLRLAVKMKVKENHPRGKTKQMFKRAI